jgi:hypothetical protein
MWLASPGMGNYLLFDVITQHQALGFHKSQRYLGSNHRHGKK